MTVDPEDVASALEGESVSDEDILRCVKEGFYDASDYQPAGLKLGPTEALLAAVRQALKDREDPGDD